jgi:hypothetical protein
LISWELVYVGAQGVGGEVLLPQARGEFIDLRRRMFGDVARLLV